MKIKVIKENNTIPLDTIRNVMNETHEFYIVLYKKQKTYVLKEFCKVLTD